ncbi:hypothetical protein, partial [Acetobacter orientalis]|uniref:hypothetical protein n=1 Tax=Acetobacter orientalis TaxID=146474 RepID=UPI0039EA3DD9
MDNADGKTGNKTTGGTLANRVALARQKFASTSRNLNLSASMLRQGGWKELPWRTLIPGTDIGLALGVVLLLSI